MSFCSHMERPNVQHVSPPVVIDTLIGKRQRTTNYQQNT